MGRHRTAMLIVLVWSSSAASLEAAISLRLLVRDSYLPDVPLLLRVEALTPAGELDRDLWDAVAVLSTRDGARLSTDTVTLRNGIGSALLTIEADDDVELIVRVGELQASRTLSRLRLEDRHEASGDLPVSLTEWSGVVHVTGDLRVPPTAILRLLPGTLVLLDGVSSGEDGTDIDVDGRLEALGTEAEPVTFTAADPSRPWGELDVDDGGDAFFQFTVLTRGAHSPGGGHTGTGPTIRCDDAKVVMESCSMSDLAGKAVFAHGAELRFRHTLVARSVMGMETTGSEFVFEDGYAVEMIGEDDNDFFHLDRQGAGQEVRFSRSVFADATDDGVDLQFVDSAVVEHCLFRGLADKGISALGGTTDVQRCVFVDSDIAISAKSSDNSGASVAVDHCTFVNNRIGFEARDKFGFPDDEIFFDVTNSIVRQSDHADSAIVRTDYDPSFVTITFSNLSELWPGEQNVANETADPRFLAGPNRLFNLTADSPCVDSGDPSSAVDIDGTRTDQGALPFFQTQFVRADPNGDQEIDVSDSVFLLLYLFRGGAAPSCLKSADADDDGAVRIADPVSVLNYLFRGGEKPPTPFPSCDRDLTADGLSCRSYGGCEE